AKLGASIVLAFALAVSRTRERLQADMIGSSEISSTDGNGPPQGEGGTQVGVCLARPGWGRTNLKISPGSHRPCRCIRVDSRNLRDVRQIRHLLLYSCCRNVICCSSRDLPQFLKDPNPLGYTWKAGLASW